LVTLGGCSSGTRAAAREAAKSPFVEAAVAVKALRAGEWSVIDVRSRRACAKEHAEPAQCVPLDGLIPVAPWELPEEVRGRLARQLARAEVRPDRRVLVIASEGQAGLRRAACACWLTALAGARDCHVLAGGHEAWRRAGGEVASEPEGGPDSGPDPGPDPDVEPAGLRVPEVPPVWAGHDALRHASIEPNVAVVQAGTPGRYGEIPGAFRVSVDGVMKDGGPDVERDELIRRLGDAGLLAEDQMIVIGDGLEDGALAWFVLSRVAELPAVRLYPGGMERYRRVGLLPLEPPANGARGAGSGGASQLDDREADG
jgi:3-mercaptopyruvate sulfurtransferase SseA